MSSSYRTRTIWIHAIEAGIGLELRAKLRGESKALLLACQLHQVGSLTHDSCTSRGHLKDLLLFGCPCDHIELLGLQIRTTLVSRGIRLSTERATRPANHSRTPIATSPGLASSTTIPPHSSRAFSSQHDNGSTDAGDCVRRNTVPLSVGNRGLPGMSWATFPFARNTSCRFRSVMLSHSSVDRGRSRCFVSFVSHRPFRHGWTRSCFHVFSFFSFFLFPRRLSLRLLFSFSFLSSGSSHAPVLCAAVHRCSHRRSATACWDQA